MQEKKYLSRDEILAAKDSSIEEVMVEEWGGIVRLRTLSGLEREEYETYMLKQKANDIDADDDDESGGAVVVELGSKGKYVALFGKDRLADGVYSHTSAFYKQANREAMNTLATGIGYAEQRGAPVFQAVTITQLFPDAGLAGGRAGIGEMPPGLFGGHPASSLSATSAAAASAPGSQMMY